MQKLFCPKYHKKLIFLNFFSFSPDFASRIAISNPILLVVLRPQMRANRP
jgi:hypothetical protein